MKIYPNVRSSKRSMIATLVLAVTLSASLFDHVQARSFLDRQDNGLQKCARAILGGYNKKHVTIFGRKYNCKAMKQFTNGGRTIQISHHHRLAQDDQFYAHFRVDSRNVFVPDSLRIEENRGFALQNLVLEFRGYIPPPRNYANIASSANWIRDNTVTIRKEGKGKPKWHRTSYLATLVIIAELGNPDNRDPNPTEVGCSRPSFHVYDNFGGRNYQPDTGNYPTIHNQAEFSGLADNMSSVCVPRGYVVHMFEHSDYRGKMWEIVGPKQFYDFKRQKPDFHDNISSIRIFENTDITGN